MRFGTDGVRGEANSQITSEFALVLGRAVVGVLGGGIWGIGTDTRRSGSMLAAAVAAGLAAEGADVEVFGVVPTPGVAYWSQTTHAPAVVVSASHNPFGDNGLKLFAAGGVKLSDAVQRELEAALDAWPEGRPARAGVVPTGAAVGAITLSDPCPAYVDHLVASIGGRTLDGLRVVLDCAHGAASVIGPEVFGRLGADVTVLHDQWDGQNINDRCGSTHPELLTKAVVELGADLGCAFDGDADRMLAVDADGRVIDGDQLLAIAAIDLDSRGELVDRTVVVTVMSNLGFRLGMRSHGITVIDTKVGDRYVLEALESGGFVLGGEQSGHLIFRDAATTGDGVLAAVRTADVVRRTATPLAALADAAMHKLPQVLTNVRVGSPMSDVADRISADIAAAQSALGEMGRVLVRPSGTEPLVRVMVEAADVATARECAAKLSRAVEALD